MREIFSRCAFLSLFVPLALSAQTTKPLTLQIFAENTPAGGWVQIKVFTTTPALIQSGSISMDLDPTIFGSISQVAVFSAAGDAIGYANVSGRHVDAHFSSPSGGVGQLTGLPLFVVSVPVNGGAPPGGQTQLTLDPTAPVLQGPDGNLISYMWQDPQENPYSVTVIPAQFTVGGKLSVESVTPGTGLFPAGTVLQMQGTGFDASTTVTVGCVNLSSVTLISPQQIDITLGGATELTGKHFHVAGSTGSADFYAAPPSASGVPPTPFVPIDGVQPLMPLAALTAVDTPNILVEQAYNVGLALLNQNATPVTVAFTGVDLPTSATLELQGLVIPAGGLYLVDITTLITGLGLEGSLLWITSSAPIRMLEYNSANPFDNSSPGVFLPPPALTTPPPIQLPVSPAMVSWSWQQGTALPAAVTVNLTGGIPFQASIAGSGSAWLKATPSTGTLPVTLTLTPNPSSLPPGTYNATVLITPVVPLSLAGMAVESTNISVSLTVSSEPLIAISSGTAFVADTGTQSNIGPVWTITSNGNQAAFQAGATRGQAMIYPAVPITASVSTTSGGHQLAAATGLEQTGYARSWQPSSMAHP